MSRGPYDRSKIKGFYNPKSKFKSDTERLQFLLYSLKAGDLSESKVNLF